MTETTTTTSKPWWASKTIWANVIGFAAAIAAGFGFELAGETVTALTTGVLAVVNIVLRFVTKEPIS